MEKEVRIGNRGIEKNPFIFIGGPCVIEGRETALRHAEKLKEITDKLRIPYIFKSSYDKANRTSVKSFRGPGIAKGLKILGEIKEKLGVVLLTDVHSVDEAYMAGEVVDVVQVPALLSRQTDLVVACGKTGKAVNIKKGQFLSPWDMKHAIEKVESTGNSNILLTERGTCFGYNTLVNDFRAIPAMKEFGYPVIFDATHSVQKPGALDGRSGGERQFIFPLAKAAIAAGADGIFMEVHEDPAGALCDGENSLPLQDLSHILTVLKRIKEAL